MGFGTLFIGYFFLVNISYYAYTDIIAGLVMLLGLYKLSEFNKSFKYGSWTAIGFSALAFAEICFSMISIFGSFDFIKNSAPYVSSARYAIIFMLTYFILRGIGEIAKEVEANALCGTARASLTLSPVFLVYSAMELPFVAMIFGSLLPYIYFALILSIVIFTLSNLTTIYKAYMQICMPEELNRAPKSSKFEFMNKFYDSIEKKSQEYAKFRLEKKQNKNNKRKK